MLAIFTLFIFYSLHSTVSQSVPSPINVTFSSVNLRNVLQWFPGEGNYADETLYTVQYSIYGDRIQGKKGKRVNWKAVQHCTKIVRTWCDLTSEMWDENQGYYAKVRAVERGASSKWAFTPRRFEPKTDTTLGPPLLSVEIENNSATITMMGPMRYPSNNHTPALSMVTLYAEMTYNLSVRNTHLNQTHHFPVVGSVYKYRLMKYNMEYCFSAQLKFSSMPIHCQSSAWLCITTPQDPVIEQLQSVTVGIVVPALCIGMIIAAAYLFHRYLSGKDQHSPNILNPPSFHKSPILFPPESSNLIPISPISPEPPGNLFTMSGLEHPIYSLQVVDPPPSYSPQRHEAPLDDLSVEYGGISMAPQIIVEGEEEARGGNQDDGDRRVESVNSGGAYAPQANTSWTCKQTPMQTHGQSSAGLQSFPRSATCGLNKKKDGQIESLLNIPNMSASSSDQSDITLDDFSVNHERGLHVPLLLERGRRRSEEEYVTRARLRLDNVSVSQASDEEE
uniref:Interleukin-20 receptor subunit alpha n=1 Tax=Maylandia zebra TaxID=106582 RepID=A0A3P9C479_9CICH|nr:interleukin-20 receptor subunit alpha isoform X2 [Maylandia zebra]